MGYRRLFSSEMIVFVVLLLLRVVVRQTVTLEIVSDQGGVLIRGCGAVALGLSTPVSLLASFPRLITALAEIHVDLRQAIRLPSDRTQSKEAVISPRREVLMVQSIPINSIFSSGVFPEEVAQLPPSCDCFTEVECDVLRHADGFGADHPCQGKQVLDRQRLRPSLSPRRMTNQPGNYGPCVLFITDVDIEKTRRNAAVAG